MTKKCDACVQYSFEVERLKENIGDLETLLSEFRDGTEYKRATDEIERLWIVLKFAQGAIEDRPYLLLRDILWAE